MMIQHVIKTFSHHFSYLIWGHDGKPNNFFFGPGRDEQAMMDKVEMPVLLMPAGNDPENLKEGGGKSCVENLGRAAERFFFVEKSSTLGYF